MILFNTFLPWDGCMVLPEGVGNGVCSSAPVNSGYSVGMRGRMIYELSRGPEGLGGGLSVYFDAYQVHARKGECSGLMLGSLLHLF